MSQAGLARKRTGSNGDSSGTSEPVEELLTLQQLKLLKAQFDEHHGELTREQFVAGVQQILIQVPPQELSSWFTRIDATNEKRITWDSLSAYLAHRSHSKVVLEDSRFEYQKQTEYSRNTEDRHRDMITCTLVHPSTGKVYTCGRDGIVKQWHPTLLTHEKILHNTGTWITSAGFFRGGSRLLISSVDRQLHLFEIGTGNLVCTYAGRKYTSDRREVLQRRHLNDVSKFGIKVDFSRQPQTCVGEDTSVDEFALSMRKTMAVHDRDPFEVAVTPLYDLVSTPMSQCCLETGNKEFSALGLSDGTLQIFPLEPGEDGCCRSKCRFNLHSATISQLRYSSYLTGLISSSWDGSLKIFNLHKETVSQHFAGGQASGAEAGKTPHTVTDKAGHQKAVFAFDWSEELQILASCGSERRVYIWNPFLSQPVFRIDGHQQPLVGVSLNYQLNQMITLSQDKVMKVWDVRTFRCIQTLSDPVGYHPENYLSSLCFDEKRSRIVAASTFPVAFPLSRISSSFPANYKGHQSPVVALVRDANVMGQNILTVDRAQVIAWRFGSGEKSFQYRLAKQLPVNQAYLGQYVSRAVIDGRGPRLITLTELGNVIVWNLRNCQVSSVGVSPVPGEGTALLQCRRKDLWFVVVALGCHLLIFEDSLSTHLMRITSRFSTQQYYDRADTSEPPNICSIALSGSALLALGMDNGDIMLYNPDLGRCTILSVLPAGIAVEAMQPLSAASNCVVCGQSDTRVSVVSCMTRTVVATFNAATEGGDVSLCAMALSTSKREVLIGDSLGRVHIWQHGEGGGVPNHITTFQAHSEVVSSLLVIAGEDDEFNIVTGSVDCQVKIFNVGGIHIGTFGASEAWDVADSDKWSKLKVAPSTKAAEITPSSASFFSALVSSHAVGDVTQSPTDEPAEADSDQTPHPPVRFVAPAPPRRKRFGALPFDPGVSPSRHIHQRDGIMNTPLLKRTRIRAVSAVAASLVAVLSAAVDCVWAVSVRPAFLTEVPGEVVKEAAKVPSGIDGQEMRRRVEQRLARHGVAVTARDDTREWKENGAEVLRQMRRRRANQEEGVNQWNRFSAALKSSVAPISKPKAPQPPPNWKPSNCHLCQTDRAKHGAAKTKQAADTNQALSLLPEGVPML